MSLTDVKSTTLFLPTTCLLPFYATYTVICISTLISSSFVMVSKCLDVDRWDILDIICWQLRPQVKNIYLVKYVNHEFPILFLSFSANVCTCTCTHTVSNALGSAALFGIPRRSKGAARFRYHCVTCVANASLIRIFQAFGRQYAYYVGK